jgi:SAM-dependent methyltransferase
VTRRRARNPAATASRQTGPVSLRDAWEQAAPDWITWARTPGHDSYWKFHREALFALLPAAGELTLDIGCGEGRVARDLAGLGHRVIGFDGSFAMARAAAAHPGSDSPVVQADAALLPVRDGVADLAVAFMSLQDVTDFQAAIDEIARVLMPGGVLVMAIVHPINSVGHFDGDGDDPAPSFVITDAYYEPNPIEDRCERRGLTMTFHSEHRPLSAYTEALYNAGFLIERMLEPTDNEPGNKWQRIPMFLHIRAIKRP